MIGAAGAIAGGAFVSWIKGQQQRQSLAAALAAEVDAVREITEHRRVVEIIKTCIASLEATGNKAEYPRFPIDDHPFPVFEKNVEKIGLLPVSLAGDVTTFYTYARSAVQDFRRIYNEDLSVWPDPKRVGFFKEMGFTIEKSIDLAKALVTKLKAEAERPWLE